MAHWEHRPEPGWKNFKFNQPYAVGLKRLKEEVLAKTDFDPATLWQWGTMQAMALIQILKDCEHSALPVIARERNIPYGSTDRGNLFSLYAIPVYPHPYRPEGPVRRHPL